MSGPAWTRTRDLYRDITPIWGERMPLPFQGSALPLSYRAKASLIIRLYPIFAKEGGFIPSPLLAGACSSEAMPLSTAWSSPAMAACWLAGTGAIRYGFSIKAVARKVE